jgi:hypothetical protein
MAVRWVLKIDGVMWQADRVEVWSILPGSTCYE